MREKGRQWVLILGDEPRIAARDESEQRTLVLYGSPSTAGGGIIDAFNAGDLASESSQGVRQLNGQFAALVETSDRVLVSTDRFASHQVFYAVDNGTLVISFSYRTIWRWLFDNNRLNIDSLAFFEFLHFQRLFGETTFDRSTRTLPPATTLTFNKATGEIELERYWSPNFQKRDDGRSAIARDLADAVKESVAQKTVDVDHPSLFLSGGMDSRIVLGGFHGSKLPHCVTVGRSENNEVDVARSLAKIAGAEHSFVRHPVTHYPDMFTSSTVAGGGMYSFQHGHFFGLDIPRSDLVLHGHGFDYFFQGMYLPSSRRSFLGRSTRWWALKPVGSDLVGQYIQQAKYRLQGVESASLLLPEFSDEANERLRADLESVLSPVTGGTPESYDDWDYLTTSAPGRHYTYLNLLSINSLAEQRTIAFDNDIFDIYYSTPAEVRHGTQLLAETLKNLNPELLKVRNANTNLRPDLSPLRLTLEGWVRGANRRMRLGSGSTSADPSAADRSWPSESEIIITSPMLMSRVSQLVNSEGIGSLGIFDMKKIGNLASRFREGNVNGASALLSLLTIDEFLSNG